MDGFERCRVYSHASASAHSQQSTTASSSRPRLRRRPRHSRRAAIPSSPATALRLPAAHAVTASVVGQRELTDQLRGRSVVGTQLLPAGRTALAVQPCRRLREPPEHEYFWRHIQLTHVGCFHAAHLPPAQPPLQHQQAPRLHHRQRAH